MQYQLGYEADTALYDQIRIVAAHVRNNAADLARRTYNHRQQIDVDLEEYLVLSESATFLAFHGLGGDVDHPLAFDWSGRRAELITEATAHVRRDLQEKGSDSHDMHYRNQVRQAAVGVDELSWDAWNDRAGEARTGREQLADALDQLLPDLERLLRPRDIAILVWRYIEGRSQLEIGWLLGGDVGAGAMGLMRAKRRAARVLGARWRALLEDAKLGAAVA